MQPKAEQLIHCRLTLGDAAQIVLRTEHVQRLRRVNQTSPIDFCYPNASHSRLSHSTGVAKIARELLQSLISNSKDKCFAEMDAKYLDIVEIAGLCHDLGILSIFDCIALTSFIFRIRFYELKIQILII